MLMLRGLVRSLFQIGLFAALLLIPAGTWHWPRAIQFLGVCALLSLISIFCLARWAPASLEARVQRGTAKDQPTADRIASLFLAGLGLWLGSVVSVLVMPVIAAPIVARILIEEKTLRANLSGYAGYMTRVPYRLVPLAW